MENFRTYLFWDHQLIMSDNIFHKFHDIIPAIIIIRLEWALQQNTTNLSKDFYMITVHNSNHYFSMYN